LPLTAAAICITAVSRRLLMLPEKPDWNSN
jgi:hypothetical protein